MNYLKILWVESVVMTTMMMILIECLINNYSRIYTFHILYYLTTSFDLLFYENVGDSLHLKLIEKRREVFSSIDQNLREFIVCYQLQKRLLLITHLVTSCHWIFFRKFCFLSMIILAFSY
jgi:hypothetical protein